MSLFVTKLPVDLKPILSVLPKHSYVHSVKWDFERSTIEVHWEHDGFHSGLTVPTNFPLEDLKAKFLPPGVKDGAQDKAQATPSNIDPPEPPSAPAPEPKRPAPPRDPAPAQIRSKRDYNKAIKAGLKLEFWGVQGVWFPVVPEAHEFTEGYVYREIIPKVVDTPAETGVTAESK